MLRTTPTTNHSPPAPRGLTLVEMLISMAVTLVMMAAVVNLFANLGAGVRTRNASMELGTQLRLARARLFKDLAGATSAARPKLPSDDHEDGYLEIVEGQWSDKNPSLLTDGTDNGATSTNPELDYTVSIVPSGGDPNVIPPAFATTGAITNGRGLGDYDDILALTVRSESEPFVGPGRVFNNTTNLWEDGTIESELAEILWFAVENPADGSLGEPGMRTIYRRVLLIAPWIDLAGVAPPTGNNAVAYKTFYDRYDISVRIVPLTAGTFMWVPNTLADLTKRENRFAHTGTALSIGTFPWAIDTTRIRFSNTTNNPLWPLEDERQGEDVMLNDVLAFDLRVYDPGAPLFNYLGYVIEPSVDSVFASAVASGPPVGYGAYVDLGWDNNYDYDHTLITDAPASFFQEERQVEYHPRTPNSFRGNPATYDTWPYHYENDGIDQDDGGAGLIDEGTNKLDDDNVNGVDDSLERETAPPYDVPLRGLQVKLRVYDRDSRQIREATVTRNFVPQ